jgi:hypothetical protein
MGPRERLKSNLNYLENSQFCRGLINQAPTEKTTRCGFDESGAYLFILFFSQPSLIDDFLSLDV